MMILLTDDGSEKTITVDVDGVADFSSNVKAVEHAEDGDTVLVNSGTYYEVVVVNRSSHLKETAASSPLSMGSRMVTW